MRYAEDKRLFAVVLAVTLLAGCSSSSAQETTRNEAAPEEKSVVTLDFTELAKTQEQTLPELESTLADQDSSEEDKIAAKDKKQPPEGFTLRLASEDWGLSFGESGAQPSGNASPEDLAW